MVSPSQISSYSRTQQADDCREGVGQLRSGFRHLLQFIHDGRLAEAQQTYRDLSRSMPGVFQKLSSKLTLDFDAIGRALQEGDIPGARRAVVQLKEDLQDIQPAGNFGRRDQGTALSGESSPASYGASGSRQGGGQERHIGTHIDIIA